MSNAAVTKGAHHIGLTVPNLEETRSFFVETLGFSKIGELPEYPAVFLTDGTTMLTLWQATDPDNAVPFDRKNNIGLHHFALTVADSGVLDSLYHKLDTSKGCDIEFAPEPLLGGPTKHMMCFIPGGIRMELIAPAG